MADYLGIIPTYGTFSSERTEGAEENKETSKSTETKKKEPSIWTKLAKNMEKQQEQDLQMMMMMYNQNVNQLAGMPTSDNNKELSTEGLGRFDGEIGNVIAASAQQTAGNMDTRGACAKGVRTALEAVGIDGIRSASAYQIAPKLENHKMFKEVKVDQNKLGELPKGAIVVWSQSERNPHGHISIALGDGREASDHIRPQLTRLNSTSTSTARVFLPKESGKLDTEA